MVLETINTMILEGDAKGYLPNSPGSSVVKYYKTVFRNVKRRDLKLNQQLEPAVQQPLDKKTLSTTEQIDQIMYRFNAKRSRIFCGRESSKHEKLRMAAEDMKAGANYKFSKYAPEKEKLTYFEDYITRIDEVIYRADKYIKDKGRLYPEQRLFCWQ